MKIQQREKTVPERRRQQIVPVKVPGTKFANTIRFFGIDSHAGTKDQKFCFR